MTYIPDLTERFPEGFDGVDMTPAYFGEPVDWSKAIKEDYFNDGMEIPFECDEYDEDEPHPFKFEVGEVYCYEMFYSGGMSFNKCVGRTESKVQFVESNWLSEMDNVTRKPEWYDIDHDDVGNEIVKISEHCTLRSNMSDGFNED